MSTKVELPQIGVVLTIDGISYHRDITSLVDLKEKVLDIIDEEVKRCEHYAEAQTQRMGEMQRMRDLVAERW